MPHTADEMACFWCLFLSSFLLVCIGRLMDMGQYVNMTWFVGCWSLTGQRAVNNAQEKPGTFVIPKIYSKFVKKRAVETHVESLFQS